METRFMKRAAMGAMVGAAMLAAGVAQAAFEGRDATFAASSTCTASGATKCTYFYDTTLDITILNNWNIGRGFWDAGAAAGSAQALAATAGFAASGLTGWVLPTGDGGEPAGNLNQYLSIWNSVGNNFVDLSAQFDGVQISAYWSGTVVFAPNPGLGAWYFLSAFGAQSGVEQINPLSAVAVRPGDVAAVPEPQAYAMALLGLGVLTVLARRRPR
jgi:MYXO-CTERM domain-containing protein